MLTALLSMFLPLIGIIVVNALFWKLAAKILRYGGVTWLLSFLVAATLVFASVFVRGVLAATAVRLPSMTALILSPVLPVVLGAWCFHDRATSASGQLVGWPGALRLSALSLALSVLVSAALMFALFTFTGGLRGTLS
jgi:hypothetical protein